MTILDAIAQRHSVRKYQNVPLKDDDVVKLNEEIKLIEEISNLKIKLFVDEPNAFKANKPNYGFFSGCRNYFTIIGPKDCDEEVGYYGERLVLFAQSIGLNTCWVALTYEKGKVEKDIQKGEKLHIVIAVGYGENMGFSHKSKEVGMVSDLKADDPEWYKKGIEAAMLAPTAINQQKFKFKRHGNLVKVKAGLGVYAKMDLGIVKYHFEIGAGTDNFSWE